MVITAELQFERPMSTIVRVKSLDANATVVPPTDTAPLHVKT